MTYAEVYDLVMKGNRIYIVDEKGNSRYYFKNNRGYARQRLGDAKAYLFPKGNNDLVPETSRIEII